MIHSYWQAQTAMTEHARQVGQANPMRQAMVEQGQQAALLQGINPQNAMGVAEAHGPAEPENVLRDALSALSTWRACAQARAAQLDDLRAVRPRIAAGDPAPDGAQAVLIDATDYEVFRAMFDAMRDTLAKQAVPVPDAAPEFPARALRFTP
jgi:hypothetical protein